VEPYALSGEIGARDFSVLLQDGATTARRYAPAAAGRPKLLVLAHGAGAGQRHPFMVAIATRLAEAGVEVVTFNFPYLEQKRRVPDRAPVLEACFRAVIAACTEGRTDTPRVFIGGKSMGGRMATHLAAQGVDGLCGVVALGYPLHPPGKPEQRRTAHLPSIAVPVLVVQGERDTFGTPGELAPVIASMQAPVRLHVVAGGDHSLTVRGTPRDAVYASVCAAVVGWMGEIGQPDSANGATA
jgi:predicted alpha/beta-hydrolase family hydrolase